MKIQVQEMGFINVMAIIIAVLLLVYQLIGYRLYNKVDETTQQLNNMSLTDIIEYSKEITNESIQ